MMVKVSKAEFYHHRPSIGPSDSFVLLKIYKKRKKLYLSKNISREALILVESARADMDMKENIAEE